MPVQFTCSQCRRTLSVARRKGGTTVACPKCGQANVVPHSGPSEELLGVEATAPIPPIIVPPVPPAVGLNAAKTASQRLVTELGTFDDIPDLIGDTPSPRPRSTTSVASPPIPPPIPSSVVGAASEIIVAEGAPPLSVAGTVASRLRRQPNDAVLLITRQAVYLQAGLMAGLLIIAFLAGLLIGRSHPSVTTTVTKTGADEPVALEGHVLYAFSPGESLPDAGAIVMALPAERQPDEKITSSALHADDDELSADALRRIGGAFARAGDQGQFEIIVPRTGEYHVLMISQHAVRPDDSTIAVADTEELGHYFDDVAALIRQRRYALTRRRLSGAPSPLTQEFGPTDKR